MNEYLVDFDGCQFVVKADRMGEDSTHLRFWIGYSLVRVYCLSKVKSAIQINENQVDSSLIKTLEGLVSKLKMTRG